MKSDDWFLLAIVVSTIAAFVSMFIGSTLRTEMKINALQATLLATYAGGEYKDLQRSEDLRDCGDSLLLFLFSELDEDCYNESRDTGIPVMIVASKRLLKAAEEITHLNSAIVAGE